MPEMTETEPFTFVVATDDGYSAETFFGNRHYADKKFTHLCDNTPRLLGVYYYALSSGGLVNAYHTPKACG